MSKNVAVPAMCVAAASGITKDVTVQYIEPHLPIMTGSKNKAQNTTRGEKFNKAWLHTSAQHFLLMTVQHNAAQYSTVQSTVRFAGGLLPSVLITQPKHQNSILVQYSTMTHVKKQSAGDTVV